MVLGSTVDGNSGTNYTHRSISKYTHYLCMLRCDAAGVSAQAGSCLTHLATKISNILVLVNGDPDHAIRSSESEQHDDDGVRAFAQDRRTETR